MKRLLTLFLFAVPLYAHPHWEAWQTKVLATQEKLPGWCTREKALQMMHLIYEVHPQCCVEIGVFGASSFFPTACALRYLGEGVAYGIDPWATQDCLVGYAAGDPNYEWWSKINLENIFQGVVRTIKDWHLEPHCKLLRTTGRMALAAFADESIDILHIDGNHTEEEALQDAKLYLPKVKKGGYIWFDDINWPSTAKAVNWLRLYCEVDEMRSTSAYLLLKRTDWSLNVAMPSTHRLPQETTISQFFKKGEPWREASGLINVDCVYVLNLDIRPEKWESTQQALDPYPIGLNRFSGIYGAQMSEEAWQALWQGQGLKKPSINRRGSVGCTLSHLSILQDAYDRGDQCIWILEDDIEVLKDPMCIDEHLAALQSEVPDWGLLYTDLDMRSYDRPDLPLKAMCITGAFRLGQETLPEEWYLERHDLNDSFQEIRLRYGFHSVLVSRRGMELILDYFKHTSLHSALDIDVHFIPHLKKYGLKTPIISNACGNPISGSAKQVRLASANCNPQ